ncbi:hCG2008078 [Homo sapiens]|uniref:HCG2008078 n=1 Tax=Homo sapiens TaxID=9606 RepID=Q8N4W5_HUMAN
MRPKHLQGIAPEVFRTPTGSHGQMPGQPLQRGHALDIRPPLRPHPLISGHALRGDRWQTPALALGPALCGFVPAHWVLTVPPPQRPSIPSRSADTCPASR